MNCSRLNKSDEIILQEKEFRDPRKNAEKAINDFETEMNKIISDIKSARAQKLFNEKQNNNPAKLKKANEKRLKEKRMKKYNHKMRNKFDD